MAESLLLHLSEEGINRQEGVTSHGLRHERLNEIYQEITEIESPVKTGKLNSNWDIDNRIAPIQ